MNRLYIFEHERHDNDKFLIKDLLRVNHINKILKKSIGDLIKITYINHGIGNGEILEVNKSFVLIKINKILSPESPKIHLLIGLSRPPTMKKIIEHGTSMGVQSFTFFNAFHSEKSYMQSKIFNEQNIMELLALGLSQSGCFYNLPAVSTVSNFSKIDFGQFQSKIYFSLNSKHSFQKFENNIGENLILTIGPERGWTKDEEENLNSLEFKDYNLGKPILRTEIATFVALGQLI